MPSMTSPTAAPANRKPLHGKIVKFVRPGVGRKYHSTGSGNQSSSHVVRTMGVTIAMLTAIAENSSVRRLFDFTKLPANAASAIAGPITLRISTFSRLIAL